MTVRYFVIQFQFRVLPNMLIFSVHGDTNFKNHQLHHLGNGAIKGHLDNFAGVYCIMQAYFSGHLNKDYVRIEITYGEEVDFEGARNVRKEVSSRDMVVVIDVTGAETDKLFVVEKCRNENMRNFLHDIFSDMSCDIYSNCPDTVASQDESDIYCSVTPHCFFLGVNTSNGDYNEGQVESHTRYLDATRDAVIRLVERYPDYAAQYGLDTAAADGPILMRTTTEEKCGCNGAGFYSNTVMQCDKCNKKITLLSKSRLV